MHLFLCTIMFNHNFLRSLKPIGIRTYHERGMTVIEDLRVVPNKKLIKTTKWVQNNMRTFYPFSVFRFLFEECC